MSLKKLTPVAAAVTLGVSAMTAPVVASAEMSTSVAASNFYLWRGQDLTGGSAAVSGSLDYSHESGLYTGVWASSEGAAAGGTEYDLYVGFGGEAGDFSYDISVWEYMYPDDPNAGNNSDDIGDASEAIISLGFADFSATAYFSLQTSDTQYITLGYSMDKLGFTLGTWSFKNSNNEYTHFDISYAANDEVTFTFSKIVDIDDANSFNVGGNDDDMIVNVTWAKSFDL